MADVLTGPLAVAALVLVVAGVAKLRSPAPAVAALRDLVPLALPAPPALPDLPNLPASAAAVRMFAACEVALGVWAVANPTRAAAIALGCCYAAFAALGVLLATRRAACGCFGESDFPASPLQALLSAVLAVACVAAAVWPPQGILDRPTAQAVVLVIGIAGSAYATVVAYTLLPAAWSAWSAR